MYFNRLCHLYEQMDEVEALVLGGSRASGKSDENSDYDLYVYCSSLPDENRRKEILEECCERIELGNTFWETEDDCTLKNEVDIDIIYRSLDDFEQSIHEVVDECRSHNGYTTCMWHNLLNSRMIYDRDGRYEALQKKYDVAYPKQLQENIIHHNLRLLTGSLASYDRQIHKAVERKDLVSLNHRTAAYLESYFDIIFAMNEMTHPGEKRMLETASKQAEILPHNFERNILHLLGHLFNEPEVVDTVVRRMNRDLKACLQEHGLLPSES